MLTKFEDVLQEVLEQKNQKVSLKVLPLQKNMLDSQVNKTIALRKKVIHINSIEF